MEVVASMPWSKPCGGAWRRNVMITFQQLATLALLSIDARQLGASRPQQRAHGSNECLCPWPANASVSVPDSHTSTDSCDQRTATSAFVPLSVGTGRQPRCKRMSTSSQELAQLPPQLAQARHGIERTVPHLLIDSRPGPKSGAGCRLTT